MGKELAFPAQKVGEIETQTQNVETEALAVKVTSKPKYDAADELIRQVLGLKAAVHETFDPVVSAAHTAHKEAVAACKKHLDPLERAERHLRRQMSDWAEAEERKRLEAEAKKRAEAERKLREAREAEAAALREEGAEEEAEELEQQPVIVPDIELKDRTKLDNVSYREDWKYRIADRTALRKWLYENHPNLLIIDESTLGKMVRAMKGNTNIPGVQAYSEKVMVRR